MQFTKALAGVLAFSLAVSPTVIAQETEQDVVNRYLQRMEKTQVMRLGWVSAHFGVNRINRHNDYNDFAILESAYITGGELSWVKQAYSFGAEFGIVFKERLAWSLGGEYWLKLGEQLDGSFIYSPPAGGAMIVTDPSTEIQVYGACTGFDYYFYNHPSARDHLTGLALRAGGRVGFYIVKWDIWPEYENLNLATSQPANTNTTYQGTAPGLTMNVGLEYPISLWGLVAAVDLSYLYLNFSNVAWYNAADQEVVVSYDRTEDGRVDLNLSGIRARLEVKRFLSW
ncbi:MAG TPA: hypothetical protein VMY05_09610 [Acidobacteriota bacterium]|nr:hypothetical protein [Acidobacteriota bacterium]